MNRWDSGAFEYSAVDKIRDALVGRSIVNTLSEGTYEYRVLTFVLDDGSLLRAHATDGGCACANGCFTVEPGIAVKGTITAVEVQEVVDTWDADGPVEVEPGSVSDGSATIRVFVYSELGEQLLVESSGGDNGYYGWGFWLDVLAPEVAA